jgi:hypothetical protein
MAKHYHASQPATVFLATESQDRRNESLDVRIPHFSARYETAWGA